MKKLICLVLFVSGITLLQAQKQITVNDFTTKNTFAQRAITGINWMKNGKFYSTLNDNKIIKYDITTGQIVETIVDGALLTPAITMGGYSFSDDEKQILILTNYKSIYRRSFTAEYFIYDIPSKSLKKLSEKGRQSYATFSPDGTKIAFVRDNNLFFVDIQNTNEVQVTTDGKFNSIINGTTDWVYEEEFSFVEAFYWSPDSKKLAYHRFDETGVKEYNMQRWNKGQLYPEDYRFKYPKAGEANSLVEIWIYDVASKQKVNADLGAEKDIYIPRVKWTENPNVLSVKKLNRLQNNLQLLHVNASTGATTVVLNEKSETYIDLDFLDDLTYLSDGKHFIHASEANGFKHLYLYSINGALVKQITTGNYEVSQFLGMDEKAKLLYYVSTEVSPMEKHFYSISLDGKKKVKLSKVSGVHKINMSIDFQFYIDHHSSSTQPTIASLYKTKGNVLLKVLEKNETLSKTAEEYQLSKKEFFTYPSEGTIINGFMLKPLNFDSTKQYPVLVYQYSGPGSQDVVDTWGGSHWYFHQMLTQKGYIVAFIDTRGTGSRGEKFKKITYKQLGKYELEDIIAAAKYLTSLNYVDGSRIGIWGWSYGGYMASLTMTKGSGSFKLGIAVAPVTNWRFYDTIYTERYLQTPALNADGYDLNSPSTHAGNFKGKFLLIHGTGDDNVHFQNSIVLQETLINAGKQFESFYYPDKHHGIQGAQARHHLYTMMADFILDNL
jgi:dipeptidyl-peptidase-4